MPENDRENLKKFIVILDEKDKGSSVVKIYGGQRYHEPEALLPELKSIDRTEEGGI